MSRSASLLASLLLVLLPVTMGDHVRGCFITNWAQYRPGKGRFVPENYEPGLCTHMFFAFGTISPEFLAKAFDPADLPNDWAGAGMYARVNALKKRDPQLKTLLSFGGWNFGTAIFKKLASTASSRATFISSALAFVDEHGFDGIDIDWEYPDASDRQNFVLLMGELKQAFGSRLVTAALSAAQAKIDLGYDVAALANILDLALIMTYDFHGGWEQFVGHNSPLYSHPGDGTNFNMAYAMEYWALRGMPKKKLVVGIAAYGRGWRLAESKRTELGARGSTAPAAPFTGEAGYGAYYEASNLSVKENEQQMCKMLEKGAIRYWDDVAQVPYLVHGNLWYGYDDVQSVRGKMNWLKRQTFGGAFVWTLDLDDFSGECGVRYPILSTIQDVLAPGAVTSPYPWTHPSTPPSTTSFNRLTTTRPSSPYRPSSSSPRPPPPSPTQPSSSLCPQENGFFPDPSSCARFVHCANGAAFVKDCPPSTEWSSKAQVRFNQEFVEFSQACDFPPFSDCGSRSFF